MSKSIPSLKRGMLLQLRYPAPASILPDFFEVILDRESIVCILDVEEQEDALARFIGISDKQICQFCLFPQEFTVLE